MHIHLFQISAFWRNDQPDGIGVTITEEAFTVPLTDVMDEIMENYWQMWIEAQAQGATDELVSDLVAQLTAASWRRESLGIRDAVCVIGNIWLLERVGYIEADEYNGCVFAAAGGLYQAIPPSTCREGGTRN